MPITPEDLYNWNKKPHHVTLTYMDGSTIQYTDWTCSQIRHKCKNHPVTGKRFSRINIYPEPARTHQWVDLETQLDLYHKHPYADVYGVSYEDLSYAI
jgi:hypothetical protein